MNPSELQIGDLRIHSALRRVTRNGATLPVTGKAFEILLALAQRPGQVLTKDQLMDIVWPDVEVEENNLTVNISLLRRALGDLAQSPRYIVTVSGRGYTLGVPVSPAPPPPAAPTPGAPLPATPRWKLPAFLTTAAILLFAALFGAALWRPHLRRDPRSPITSIVVLPFQTEGFPPAEDTPGAGFGSDLADALSLRIAGRTQLSVRKAASSTASPAAIGKTFAADAVLYGQIQKSADSIRIAAHLQRVSTAENLWSDDFRVPAAPLFDLEDTLSARIAEALPLPALPSHTSRGTAVPEAFKDYMRARYWADRYTPEGYRNALAFLRSAIEKDPAFAEAYVGLAQNYYNSSNLLLPPSDAMPRARAAAERALQLDDQLSSAHASLGLIAARYAWDWPLAEREFSRALALDPRNMEAHRSRGIFFAQLGRFPQAEQELQRAQQLDPLSADTIAYAGLVSYWKGDYGEAKARARRALELDPHLYPAFVVIGWSSEAQGDFPSAIEAFQHARSIDNNPWTTTALAEGYARAGQPQAAHKLLIEVQRSAGPVFVSPYDIALVHLALQHQDEALQWLARAVHQRAEWMSYAAVDPHLDDLRANPQFLSLLQQMQLPETLRQPPAEHTQKAADAPHLGP